MPVADVWKTPPPGKASLLWTICSQIVFVVIATCSKFWIGYFNRPVVHGRDVLLSAIQRRPKHKPLITVSNHYSLIDDPLLAYMLPWRQIWNTKALRWLLGAKCVCFRSSPSSTFFQLGKVLPVVTGDGVYQQSMNFCVDRLNDGDWVHLFPEGKVNTSKEFMRLKWGIGRLVSDSTVPPLVLPYWHLGLADVLPNRKPYKLQAGHNVTVVVGEPLDFEQDLKLLRQQNKTDEEIRKTITDKIQTEFGKLKVEAEKKHFMRQVKTKDRFIFSNFFSRFNIFN